MSGAADLYDRLFWGSFPERWTERELDAARRSHPDDARFLRGPVVVRLRWNVTRRAADLCRRLLRVALLRRSPWAAYDRTPEVLAEVAAVLPPDEARIVLQAGEPSGGQA